MNRFDNWTQRTATFEETPEGFYNPPQMMDFTFKGKLFTVQLSAGSSDDIDVYRKGEHLFVLVTNRLLGYCGLQVFTLSGEEVGETFDQCPYESLGEGWGQIAPFNLIKTLSEYMEV